MNRRRFPSISLLLFFVSCLSFSDLPKAFSQIEPTTGIQPLLELKEKSIHSLIPLGIKPLLLADEIESLLEKLEGVPPDWNTLRHTDITEQSERLFQFNRQRDRVRLEHKATTEEPVAFVWSGLLRQYQTDTQGFSLALGPELVRTSWGIIRFKPMNLPDQLIAVPTIELRDQLLARQSQGEHLEITIICIGTLVSDESLIYAFSHEGHQEGMILPVVSIRSLIYVLSPA